MLLLLFASDGRKTIPVTVNFSRKVYKTAKVNDRTRFAQQIRSNGPKQNTPAATSSLS